MSLFMRLSLFVGLFVCLFTCVCHPLPAQCLDETREVNTSLSNFTLALGATINLDGSALYFPCAVVYLAIASGNDTLGTMDYVQVGYAKARENTATQQQSKNKTRQEKKRKEKTTQHNATQAHEREATTSISIVY
jgi:hypothetical protein